ncbi:MarR family winged helix-turn-helix transcriptional regulator [Streptomyces sp. NPDC021212]|uniref:MarR family winged helix-turn-helix transcriptional regulator n=1 Tax=Streptomyces sp. NPDC021212 TaxID=3365118 RepID=UPI00379BB059
MTDERQTADGTLATTSEETSAGAPSEPAGVTDAVDVILQQWRRTRPDLDASPMGVIGRLSRAARLTGLHVDAYLRSEGLESWEFDVLATLRRAGAPYTLSSKELASASMIGAAAMTNRVARLLDRGLLTREPDAQNRRKVKIALTADGRELVDRVVEGHIENERKLLQRMAPEHQDQLARLLRLLLASLGDGTKAGTGEQCPPECPMPAVDR